MAVLDEWLWNIYGHYLKEGDQYIKEAWGLRETASVV
jgi:hypothetical protein